MPRGIGTPHLLLVAAMALAAGCMEEDCDTYVDYMCVCHDDDPEFDCEVLDAAYSDASPAMQDQCAVDLANQMSDDEEDGLECEF